MAGKRCCGSKSGGLGLGLGCSSFSPPLSSPGPGVGDDELVDERGMSLEDATDYLAGMTDRFACRQAVALLGWDTARLPQGIDTHL